MRKAIITLACIVGLVLAGFALKRCTEYHAIDETMKTGTLSGPGRDSFISSSIRTCEAGFPANVPKAAVHSYCTCISNKAADTITADEMKSLYDTGKVPDSLATKLQAPVAQCVSDAKRAAPQ